MKKKIAAIVIIFILTLGLFSIATYAADVNANTADIKNDSMEIILMDLWLIS